MKTLRRFRSTTERHLHGALFAICVGGSKNFSDIPRAKHIEGRLAVSCAFSLVKNTSQTYLKFPDQPACAIFCVG